MSAPSMAATPGCPWCSVEHDARCVTCSLAAGRARREREAGR